MSSGIDEAQVVSQLESEWLKGMDGERKVEGRRILDQLVADWAREANSHSEPADVTKQQRKDLDKVREQVKDGDRLTALRQELLKRQIRRLRAETFALGTSILDGEVEKPAAKKKGEPLLKEAEKLSAELSALPDSDDKKRLHRELSDGLMEALFAVEGGAMSSRLNRHGADSGPQKGSGGPPSVRPG